MFRKAPRFAVWFLGSLLLVAIFRDVLVNGRPLYCKIGGKTFYPGLRTVLIDPNKPFSAPELRALQLQSNQFEAWKNPANFDHPPLYALIPFTPGEYASSNIMRFQAPGAQHPGLSKRFTHWLGTDAEGRDIAATLISGARVSLLTGSLAMVIALAIGLLLGMIAGFFGDDQLKVRRGTLILTLVALPIAWFYAVTTRNYQLQSAQGASELLTSLGIFCAITLLFNRFGALLGHFKWFASPQLLPLDLFVMRLAELFSAVPRLILLIVLATALRGLSDDAIWLMIALIGALSWTGIAKFVRAELLRIRALDYITAARGLGLPPWRILLRHALPNALRPVFVAFAFGAAGAVLLEAYLTFLGFGGTSLSGISWGSLFSQNNSSGNPLSVWWVTVLPGLMIFLTIFSLNSIGDALSDQH